MNTKLIAQSIILCLCFFNCITHAKSDKTANLADANQLLANQEYVKAFRTFKQHQDEPLAQLTIALFYKLGWGDIAQDNTTACQWFEKAAKQGIPLAYKEMGDCIVHFQFAERLTEHKKPDYWYRLAFENGIYHASCELGKLYLGSKWFEEDVQYAIELCTMSAERSAINAQLTLGEIYSTEAAVYDINLAELWFNHAVTNGSGEAAYKLAKLYQLAAEKVDEKQPYMDKSMALMEKAASLKFTQAYEEVAVMFWLKLSTTDPSSSTYLAKSYIWLKTATKVTPTVENQQLFEKVKQQVPASWLIELDQKVDDFLSSTT